LLARKVVEHYDGKVIFVDEDFGESELAKRFGVQRYPAVFVDDILVAKPKDFGFFGESGSQGGGRYTPWKDAENHKKFKQDLTRMIDLVLAGQKERLREERAGEAGGSTELAALPEFSLTDLDGNPISSDELGHRVVLVEFWATWCPPCRSTLSWLDELQKKHGKDLAVLAIAVESKPTDVAEMARSLDPASRWALGTPELAVSFGDVVAVPTLFVFDRRGKTASVFYGAPGDLHSAAEKLVDSLLTEKE
jgi:thiol-disulfide isomerase/thioredoxin